MNTHYLFSSIFFICSFVSYSQTIEDIKKLGITDSQLRISVEKRQIRLSDNSGRKHRKIKEGTFAVIKMKGDTTRMNVFLEAFLTDTIIVASWSPHPTDSESWFNELKLLPLKDIESIERGVSPGKYWAGYLMTLTGLVMAVSPVIMPLIIGNADEVYSKPQFPFMVIGGVVLYIYGRKLGKRLNLREYKLGTDWSYRVEKK